MKLKLAVALFASTLWCGWAQAQDNWAYNFVTTGTRSPGITFANTSLTAFAISWDVSPPVLSCALQVDSSADGVTWGSGDLIATQNCAVVGSVAATSLAAGKNFVRVNVTAFNGNGGVNVRLRGYAGAGGSSSSSSQNLGLNVIDPSFPSSGPAVKADTQSVSDATITNGSSTVTTGANDACFVSAIDTNKKMMGTNWNGVDLTYPTAVIALGASGATAQGTITTVNSCHSATVSTTGNGAATGAANNTFVWGHDDTAAAQNAFTLSGATALCEPIRWPGGMMWIEDVIGTNVTINCSNTQANVNHQVQISGWGKYATTFFIAPAFYVSNTTHCTGGPSSNGCFFSGAGGQGVSLVDMSFWSAGYGNTPAAVTYSLISLGIDSQLINVQLSGIAQTGGGSPTCVTMSNNYILNVIIDGCGKTGLTATSEFIGDIFIGDLASVGTALQCITLCVSRGGNYRGNNGPAVVVQNGGTFKSWGEAFICDGGSVTNAIQLGTSTSTTRADLIDDVVTCNANTGSAGVTMLDNTSAYVMNSQITGGSALQALFKSNANSTAVVYNQGGNTFSPVPSGTSSPFPSCSVATGLAGVGSTCTPDAGSLNERGTLTITAAGTPGATGALTFTFSGTAKGATNLGPSCSYTFTAGGTGAWNARVSGIMGAQSTTSSILNIDNNAANLVAASTYKVNYLCSTSL